MAILHRLGQTDLRRTKPGMYGDGGGLWLQVTKGFRRAREPLLGFPIWPERQAARDGIRSRPHRRPEGCPREGRSASQARL